MTVSEREPVGGVAHLRAVVADDERDGRLARQRDVELLLRDLDVGRVRRTASTDWWNQQVRAAADPEREREDDEQRADEDPAEECGGRARPGGGG